MFINLLVIMFTSMFGITLRYDEGRPFFLPTHYIVFFSPKSKQNGHNCASRAPLFVWYLLFRLVLNKVI